MSAFRDVEDAFAWGERQADAAECRDVATLPSLWDHQAAGIAEIDATLDAGINRIVVKIPTGGGKTRLASAFIISKKYIEAGARVGFLMPRLDLVEQTIRAFRQAGIQHVGVIQGKHHLTDATAPVQICSEQTLTRRIIPQFDLIFIDECHLQFKKILAWIDDPKLQSIPVIGLSATPWSKGLGKHYRKLINPTSIQNLIDKKILCPFVVFAPRGPDLSHVRTIAGDYHEGDLSAAYDTVKLVANIVETWKFRGEGRPTLLFAIDRKHAKHLEERFTEAGIAGEYVDGEVPMFDRVDMRFRSGETKIISSVGTMDTGVDLPLCSCIIDARPTKSVIRDVQGKGRGLRIAPGKDNLIILDHAGNTRRLGLVTDIDSDVLDDGEAAVSAEHAPKEPINNIVLCPECHAVLPKPKPSKCPQCDHVFFAVTPYQERDGELVRFGSGDRGDSRITDETKRHWYAAFLWICDEKGHSRGRAYHLFCEKFKEKPPWDWRATVRPVQPGVEQRNFVRSRAIAYAKARARG
jgi:DNA repair protein RadD